MPYGRTTLPVASKGLRREHLARPAYHCAPFGAGFGFLANRQWPTGYVDLQETKPTPKSSNLASKASFATPSYKKNTIKINSINLNLP